MRCLHVPKLVPLETIGILGHANVALTHWVKEGSILIQVARALAK